MPCRDKCYAGFACSMHILLGNFTCDKRIHSQADGLVEITLSAAGTPGYTPHWFRIITDYQGFAGQDAFDIYSQLSQSRYL